MIVVSDSTPLITLMKVESLNLIHELFGEIVIPEAVYRELTENPAYYDEAEQIRSCKFIRVIHVQNRKTVSLLQRVAGLDLGESEAIAYADENKADLLLVDEAAGRRTAKFLGLRIMGSIGILISAFKEGYLSPDEADNIFQRIRKANRHISEKLMKDALDIIHGE